MGHGRSGGEVFRKLGRTQETHPVDRGRVENRKINRAAFGSSTNLGGEMERVGYRRMHDLSRISAPKFHFKSRIRAQHGRDGHAFFFAAKSKFQRDNGMQ